MTGLYRNDLEGRLAAVGELLRSAGEDVAIVVVGGAALNLGGFLARATEDVDIYARIEDDAGTARIVAALPLPASLVRAVARVARDFDMPADWMNAVVAPQHLPILPEEFQSELSWRRYGGLHVGLAGRRTLIALKLHAAADRHPGSVHTQDLLAMRPSDAELASART